MSNPDVYRKLVGAINQEYATLESLSNDELRLKTNRIKQSVDAHDDKLLVIDELLIPIFAIVKETARRLSIGNIEVTATPNDIQLAEKYDFVEIIGNKAIFKNHWDVMGVPYQWKMAK